MKFGSVTKVLAAVFVGAMMLTPATALGYYDYGGGVYSVEHQVTTGAEAVSGLSIAVENNELVAHWSNALTEVEAYDDEGDTYVTTYKRMVIELSLENTFPDDDEKTAYFIVEKDDEGKSTLSASYLKRGMTYNVRAYILNRDANGITTYGPYQNAGTVTVPAPEVYMNKKKVGSTSVEFGFSNNDVTGYEIQRATGSGSYKKIAMISDTAFSDTGLQKNKSYTYRIRTYVQNPSTKAKVYGEWRYEPATTWGKALNLKATPGKKNTVSLKWNKISDASGYEIYRYAGGNIGTMKKGVSDSFGSYKLIKTIKKAKTTKYTDKKLAAGNTYTYMVVAYKNVKGKKVKDLTVTEYNTVSLDFEWNEYDNEIEQYNNKDGSVTMTWEKVSGATGFKVEKNQKDANGNWKYTPVTTLAGTATSYTFPASAAGTTDEYHIYAVNGTEESDYQSVTTHNYSYRSAAPGKVKATANGAAVTVSWDAVSGAAYYKVYRSRVKTVRNEDLGNYGSPSATSVRIASSSDLYSGTNKIKTLSVVDQYVESTEKHSDGTPYVINKGPELGLTYYYYVQAYRSDGKVITSGYEEDYNETDDYYDENGNVNTQRHGYYASWFGEPARVTLSAKVNLGAPKLSSVKSKKKGQAVVTWKAVKGATTYYVYCSTSKKAKNYMCVGTTTKKSFTVTGLNSKTTYYFKVKAAVGNEVDADTNMSKASGVKSAKVK